MPRRDLGEYVNNEGPECTSRKHELLERILIPSAEKMKHLRGKIAFVDGYAGPNAYGGVVGGSTAIMVDATKRLRGKGFEANALACEPDPERYDQLACNLRTAHYTTRRPNLALASHGRNYGTTTMRFLFWNVKKHSALDSIGRLVALQSIDTLILAECPVPEEELLQRLSEIPGASFWSSSPLVSSSLQILSRTSPERFARVPDTYDMPHLLLRRVTATDRTQHVLAAVHLKSKLWASPADQLRDATDTVHDIMRAEDRLAKVVRRSIVIGDLNMNPFDPGITNADGFHAVMSRKETKPAGRMVNGKRYAFYYNPMWGLLGDRGDRPPGTFRRLDGVYCLFWNMLDQVLIRPDLINRFSEESLRILDHDSQSSLLTPRGSSSPKLCDHLPFVFEMDL